MTTETSQPARPHVNPNLSLSAHDTGWRLLSAGFWHRLVLIPGCVHKSRLFKLASYRIEPSGAGGRGSTVVKLSALLNHLLLLSAPFASLVDAVQPRRSTACWGLAQDRRSSGCVLLRDGSRRSFRPSLRSVNSPPHTSGLTKAVYSPSRHGFTTAIHSKPRPGLASGWTPLPTYLGFCCLSYSVADQTDFVSLLRLSLQ